MVNKYVLDACAVVALVKDESGANVVEGILESAEDGKVIVYMNKLNLYEVFYGIRREEGLARAKDAYNMLLHLPTIIIDGISDDVLLEASRIKSSYRMSLADSIALSEASTKGASLITSDHHEFDEVEEERKYKVHLDTLM